MNQRPNIVFVTGKLAEPSLRRQVEELAARAGFNFRVVVLPITVVALATTQWIARHLPPLANFDRLVLPGLCLGELTPVQDALPGYIIERGPQDLRDLPDHFGKAKAPREGYGEYDLQIIAEINHAARLTWHEIRDQAERYRVAGADLVDVGCDPGEPWAGVGDVVRKLRGEGFRVSIDSFQPCEVAEAVHAGAELVLSVNTSNRQYAKEWGCEVVAIPDEPNNLGGLADTIERLEADGVPYRLDPILEPIGFGFAASLGRYLEVRKLYPQAELMMGVGNLTELTEVDSAGVNTLLAGFCQEVGIRSVLTTQVINWCAGCVKELDLARRMMRYAVTNQTVPKRLDSNLVIVRDPKLRAFAEKELEELQARIKDRNFRLFAEAGQIHAINADLHLRGVDPFTLFAEMARQVDLDPAHAFYLGYEMAKATTALTLGKNYAQDQALQWGWMTRHENTHLTRPDAQASERSDAEIDSMDHASRARNEEEGGKAIG